MEPEEEGNSADTTPKTEDLDVTIKEGSISYPVTQVRLKLQRLPSILTSLHFQTHYSSIFPVGLATFKIIQEKGICGGVWIIVLEGKVSNDSLVDKHVASLQHSSFISALSLGLSVNSFIYIYTHLIFVPKGILPHYRNFLKMGRKR